MKSCSKLGKIFLAAMVHELYKSGMGETTFEKVYSSIHIIFVILLGVPVMCGIGYDYISLNHDN